MGDRQQQRVRMDASPLFVYNRQRLQFPRDRHYAEVIDGTSLV